MTTVTTSEVRAHLSDMLSKIARKGNRIVVTRGGKKFAALVPLDDLDGHRRRQESPQGTRFRALENREGGTRAVRAACIRSS